MTPPNYWQRFPDLELLSQKAATVWQHKLTDLRVLRSKSTLRDGSTWIHVSVSRPDRLPSWEEISKVRDEFLGEQVEAYHVVPARKDYINVHSYCLHIWTPIDRVRRVANLRDLTNEEAL